MDGGLGLCRAQSHPSSLGSPHLARGSHGYPHFEKSGSDTEQVLAAHQLMYTMMPGNYTANHSWGFLLHANMSEVCRCKTQPISCLRCERPPPKAQLRYKSKHTWVVVKIMVPFRLPTIMEKKMDTTMMGYVVFSV